MLSGTLLYVLLTGRHPAGPPLRSAVLLFKAIVETDPGDSPTRAGRDCEPGRREPRRPTALRRQLEGDLETIVAKA